MHADDGFEAYVAEHSWHLTVLDVHGEIDLVTAPRLGEALAIVIEQHSGSVVVDLCNVPFMDSTGVHVLLEACTRLEAQNRALSIACCEHGQVHRVLTLVGVLDGVVEYRSGRNPAAGGAEEVGGHAAHPQARRSYGNERRMPRSSPAIPRVPAG